MANSGKDFEWARERVLREKKTPNAYSNNRVNFLMGEVAKNHGEKAAREVYREFNSKHHKMKDR